MIKDPPPPGHSFSYRVDVNLDGRPPFSFDLTTPGAREKFDLSTVRVGRHGGVSEADEGFRRKLYGLIGAITVAGGHVEASMKRLLLLLKGEQGGFSLVDKTWSDLFKMLLSESRRQGGERRAELKAILEWAEEKKLKDRRDNTIHASWWDFAGENVIRSRFYRRKDGAQIVGTFAELEEDAALLSEFDRRLDEL